MATATLTPDLEAAVWLQILHPDGELPPSTARAILRLSFPESEKARLRVLSTKARAGTLTDEDEQTMDAYERAGALLSILKSKARQVLKKNLRGH